MARNKKFEELEKGTPASFCFHYITWCTTFRDLHYFSNDLQVIIIFASAVGQLPEYVHKEQLFCNHMR